LSNPFEPPRVASSERAAPRDAAERFRAKLAPALGLLFWATLLAPVLQGAGIVVPNLLGLVAPARAQVGFRVVIAVGRLGLESFAIWSVTGPEAGPTLAVSARRFRILAGILVAHTLAWLMLSLLQWVGSLPRRLVEVWEFGSRIFYLAVIGIGLTYLARAVEWASGRRLSPKLAVGALIAGSAFEYFGSHGPAMGVGMPRTILLVVGLVSGLPLLRFLRRLERAVAA
jgi:hypothetical protein